MKNVCMLVLITGMIHAGEAGFPMERYQARPDVRSSERSAGQQAPYEPDRTKEKFEQSQAQYSSALYQTEVLQKDIQAQKSSRNLLTRTERKELSEKRDAKKQTRILTSSDYKKLPVSQVPSTMEEVKFSAFTGHAPAGGPFAYVLGADVLALGQYIDSLNDTIIKKKFNSLSAAKDAFYQSIALCDSFGLKKYFNDQGELATVKPGNELLIKKEPLSDEKKQALMSNAQQLSDMYDKLLAAYDERMLSTPLPSSVVKERLATLDQLYRSQFPDGVTTMLGSIKKSAIDECIKVADQVQLYLDQRPTEWEPARSFANAIPQLNKLLNYLLVAEQALKETPASNSSTKMALGNSYATFKNALILLDQNVAKNFSDQPWRTRESLSQAIAVGRIDALSDTKNIKSSDKENQKAEVLIVTGYDLLRHALGEQLIAMSKLFPA